MHILLTRRCHRSASTFARDIAARSIAALSSHALSSRALGAGALGAGALSGVALSVAALGLSIPRDAAAAVPAAAPQVLIAITNSESMDGTTSGAIMVGSGSLSTSFNTLAGSSSPASYSVPAGFNPPLNAGANGLAPYTVGCAGNSGNLCDNGPSRLNLAKSAISQVLSDYGTKLNFGLYNYLTSGTALYTTWVYYMSPPGGFTFTNTAPAPGTANVVANPCYQYTSASATVNSNCNSIAALYPVGQLAGNAWMNISQSSDDPQINDVLYWSAGYAAFLSYGTVTPANPYTAYSLNTYNTNIGGYSEAYSKTAPNLGFGWQTTPTNAGYVPYTPQVLYAMRGYGYGGSQSATTGSVAVPMGTDPTTSTAFTAALAPETNNAGTKEIKAVAGQSALGGLLSGALSYMNSLSKITCQGQYVILLTDGLPTLDLQGHAWPPLGTITANQYGLTATFNADGSFKSSNSQAVTDAIAAVANLKKAGIKTYVIGLGAGVDASVNPMAAQVLQAMAVAGDTNGYFAAGNAQALNNAFQAIVDQIYNASSVAAPFTPPSVTGGSLEYLPTFIPSPAAGHVSAFPVDANGVPTSQTPAWEAGALMTANGRANALQSNTSGGAMMLLSQLANSDPSAFSLAATACVPDVATIVSFTIDPSYHGPNCSYLANRQPGAFLGTFSMQSSVRYIGPPSNSALTTRYPDYVGFARRLSSIRTPMLVFNNNDGFVYAIDAKTGQLRWGWMSRNLLPQLQNYASFQAGVPGNGGLDIVDAKDSGGTWHSYLVGSLQSGAEHYSIQLNDDGSPAKVIYDTFVSGGTSPGDASGVTGAVARRQPVQVAYVGNSAYAIYIINTVVSGSTISTLYESNIATGATTSKALTFQSSAAIYLNQDNNQLWLGGADGSVWATAIANGNATTDLALIQRIGTTVDPVSLAVVKPVLYVGYFEQDWTPYAFAATPSQFTVFNVSSSGWAPIWAATTAGGYQALGSTFTASSQVNRLEAGGVVSDLPSWPVGGVMAVPMFMPGPACSPGSGYNDLFSVADGSKPTDGRITLNGVPVTGSIYVGQGPAFTPTLTLTSTGLAINTGSQATLTPPTPLQVNGRLNAAPFSWRQP